MSQFVVHALMTQSDPGMTNEMSIECESIDDVCRRIREFNTTNSEWRVISIFHIEDWPMVMDGARHV